MARAKLYYIPGVCWHITHRCHNRDFLLKFSKDRKRWLYWLFQARKRFGLHILNYAVTSNHIHLLVYDDGRRNVIPKSIHLAASRIAREYNRRKKRRGAFWEDRYHATAIESGTHLNRCMLYIDFNMIRAGVVKHPQDWSFCGYGEIVVSKQRYRLIDKQKLLELLNLNEKDQLRKMYSEWIESSLVSNELKRESQWTEGIAVGSKDHVESIKVKLGAKTNYRKIIEEDGTFILKDEGNSYKMFSSRKSRV